MAKLAKSTVEFEHPAKGERHCGQCRHFMSPDACRIVAGRVTARDWCDRFESRSEARAAKRGTHLDHLAKPTTY